MTVTKVYEMYINNRDVRDYIDKFCKTRNVPLHTAVLYKVVQNYVDYVLSKGDSCNAGTE